MISIIDPLSMKINHCIENMGAGTKVIVALIIAGIIFDVLFILEYFELINIRGFDLHLSFYASAILQAYATISGISIILFVFAVTRTKDDIYHYQNAISKFIDKPEVEHLLFRTGKYDEFKWKLRLELFQLEYTPDENETFTTKNYNQILEQLKKYKQLLTNANTIVNETHAGMKKFLIIVGIVILVSVLGFYEASRFIFIFITTTIIFSIIYMILWLQPLFNSWVTYSRVEKTD